MFRTALTGCALACALVASGAEIRVVATGDSLTQGYSSRLAAVLDAAGLPASVTSVASGGANSKVYSGQQVDLNAGTRRDMGSEALATNPDVVLFMLGVNDALRSPDQFATYAALVGAQFDAFDAAGVRVVVGSTLPVLADPNRPELALADARLQSEFNPWLEAQALARGYVYLDNYTAIGEQPDWQSWYSDDAQTPGHIHLWGDAAAGYPGYAWLAGQFARGIAASYKGDANLDGRVTGADYLAWASHLHSPGGFTDGDFNLDGQITGADYTIWASDLRATSSALPAGAAALPVPEPASGLLLALSAVCWALVRRRRG